MLVRNKPCAHSSIVVFMTSHVRVFYVATKEERAWQALEDALSPRSQGSTRRASSTDPTPPFPISAPTSGSGGDANPDGAPPSAGDATAAPAIDADAGHRAAAASCAAGAAHDGALGAAPAGREAAASAADAGAARQAGGTDTGAADPEGASGASGAAGGPLPGGGSGTVDARGALRGEALGSCVAAAGGGAATALPEAQAGARGDPASTTGAEISSAPVAQSSQRAGADEAGRGAGSSVPAGSAAGGAGASVHGDTDAVDSRGGHREGAGAGGRWADAGGAGGEQGRRRGAAEPPAAEPSLACAPPERSPGADTREPQGGEGGGAFDDPLGVRGSGEAGFFETGSGHEDGAAAEAGPPFLASPDAKAGAGARAAPEADVAQSAAEREIAAVSPGASPFLDVHARAGDAGHVSPDAPGAAARPAGSDAGHLSAQGSPREVCCFSEPRV